MSALLALMTMGVPNAYGQTVAARAFTGPLGTETWLPFGVGESLIYSVRIGGLGASGRGEMSVRASADVRGVPVLHLRSEMKAGVGPFTGSGRSESWIDVSQMAALRFTKSERQFLARHEEAVEMFPATQRWAAADGTSGASPTNAPLDELSFIYFIRTLPLLSDTTYRVTRHFDELRNPTELRVLRGDSISTPAGRFGTVLVEMRVRDPRHYRGEGTIRLNLTDDACHLPVRIESSVPGVGKTVLTLESFVHPDTICAAIAR
jgi:hypothetical protein